MKIKFIIISICLLVSTWSKAQICFIDTQTKLPIPALNIYHETGTLIGFTDKNGKVQFLHGVNVNQLLPITITAQHISYEIKVAAINTLEG